MKTRRMVGAIAVAALVLLIAQPMFAIPGGTGGFNGAIFDTDSLGAVDKNLYSSKDGVYLTGGPINCSAGSSLPDGDYYFQVTDPSGATLLSSDDISNRTFHVSGGFIVSTTGSHTTVMINRCSVATLAVQLQPFADTTNAGGEYKIWVTPQSEYKAGYGTFGFLNSWSKTDNFKVQSSTPPPTPWPLAGTKWYDLAGDGQSIGDIGLPGFTIDIYKSCQDGTDPGDDSHYGNSSGFSSDQSQLTAHAGDVVQHVSGDPDTAPHDGFYQFAPLSSGGHYGVCEVVQPSGGLGHVLGVDAGWYPIGATQLLDISAPTTSADFLNVCMGYGNTRSAGYWSNKNGQAQMTAYGDANWKAGLNALNLYKPPTGKNGVGTLGKVFTSYADFRSWLLGATSADARYMLSAQYAAMWLNIHVYGQSDGAGIYISALSIGIDPSSSSGFITLSELMNDAACALIGMAPDNTGACTVALTAAEARDFQTRVQRALAVLNANEGNLNVFVQDPNSPGFAAKCTATIPTGSCTTTDAARDAYGNLITDFTAVGACSAPPQP